jgi:hypothetical protein
VLAAGLHIQQHLCTLLLLLFEFEIKSLAKEFPGASNRPEATSTFTFVIALLGF